MAELRLRLLGGLEVEGVAPRQVGSRKARRLLAALATPPRRSQRVDALAELIWGEDQPSKPGEQIGVLVSRLRGTLGPDHVERTDAGYRLASYWVDVEELEIRTEAAHGHLVGGDGLAARLAATMALDLAVGPLLPEEDGPWFDAPRAAASRTVGRAALVAAEASLLVGDPLGGAAAASIALDHDPYDEAALRALMRSHAAAGRPASALAAYAEVRSRLRDDLGVSPSAATEALHNAMLLDEPVTTPPASEAAEAFDPLVQRARQELATNDVVAAGRDAAEAVRRGGGPVALELAGWTAYYTRDFEAALRWAEEAAERTPEPERRASSLTLAARIRHSAGDLKLAEMGLQEAVQSTVPGIRAMAQLWLGSLRAHQGEPGEALALVRAGAVDAAAARHPFVIPNGMSAQVMALGQQGRVADALAHVAEMDRILDDLGPAGDRYRPAALNYRAWILNAIGCRDEADRCSVRAVALTNTLQEARAHAVLDLARSALDAGDLDAAEAHLDAVAIPADVDGTMVWHQRQREGILRAGLALDRGQGEAARRVASAVVEDASDRGAGRAEILARAVVLEASAIGGEAQASTDLQAFLDRLEPVAGLERWRVAGRLARATGQSWLWDVARTWAHDLSLASGERRDAVARFTAEELSRLGG